MKDTFSRSYLIITNLEMLGDNTVQFSSMLSHFPQLLITYKQALLSSQTESLKLKFLNGDEETAISTILKCLSFLGYPNHEDILKLTLPNRQLFRLFQNFLTLVGSISSFLQYNRCLSELYLR